MGLLDDLKKQADQVRTQQLSQQQLRAENLKLVEEKMKLSFQYLHELLKQLAVLQPVNPIVYSIPNLLEFKDLKFSESFIDYRKTRIDDQELFDSISFYIKWSGPSQVTIDRDMPTTAAKVREQLFPSGIKFKEEEFKGERGTVSRWRFTADAAVITDITMKADPAQGRIVVSGKNLLRLGTDDFIVPPADINEAWLEDFAITVLGQPGNFRKYRGVVTR